MEWSWENWRWRPFILKIFRVSWTLSNYSRKLLFTVYVLCCFSEVELADMFFLRQFSNRAPQKRRETAATLQTRAVRKRVTEWRRMEKAKGRTKKLARRGKSPTLQRLLRPCACSHYAVCTFIESFKLFLIHSWAHRSILALWSLCLGDSVARGNQTGNFRWGSGLLTLGLIRPPQYCRVSEEGAAL